MKKRGIDYRGYIIEYLEYRGEYEVYRYVGNEVECLIYVDTLDEAYAAIDAKHAGALKTYKTVMVSGSVKKDMYCHMTLKRAEEVYDYYGGVCSPDGGFEWDIEIEEEAV